MWMLVGYFHALEPCHNVCLPTKTIDAIYPIMLINMNFLTALSTVWDWVSFPFLDLHEYDE